jgi:hypothetical protein
MHRRALLRTLAGAGAGSLAGCVTGRGDGGVRDDTPLGRLSIVVRNRSTEERTVQVRVGGTGGGTVLEFAEPVPAGGGEVSLNATNLVEEGYYISVAVGRAAVSQGWRLAECRDLAVNATIEGAGTVNLNRTCAEDGS